MKRILVLLLGLFLVGCTRVNYNPKDAKLEVEESDKESTTICNGDNETITFYAKGDKIEKMERSFLVDLSSELQEDTNRDELMAQINNTLNDKYGKYDGISFQTSWEENAVRTVLTIDYNVAKQDDLIDCGLITEGSVESQYVSLEKTLLDHQQAGYACGVQE